MARWTELNLRKMLDAVHAGDVVVVVKLDRLARSLRDLLDIIEKIENMPCVLS